MYSTESISGYIIQYVQVSDFTVEDVSKDIQHLNGKIQKQFTSQASSYSVVFKWDFGDGTPILNASQRTILHEYTKPGRYTVKHQACLLDAPCCYNNDIPWCLKTITVREAPAEAGMSPILVLGLAIGFLFMIAKKKKTQD